ncbi:hypothetical protein EP331_08490 [bacterium]|nr:MAG: hypothetical protein EP331_08490 [bacterium]
MKLNVIRSIENAQAQYKTNKTMSLSNLSPLSSDEKMLIQEQFPYGANKKLELYLANGNSRMENPEAKGRNFDFRV